jgi:hypothetical protein
MKNMLKSIVVLFSIIYAGPLLAQTISPYLYGQNHWMADGDEGRVGHLDELWTKVKDSGVTIVRIGGAGYESHFPPRDKLNTMIDNIQSTGAEVLLQVPRHFTALQAQELVEYYTKTDKRRVKFWSVGNEPLLHDEQTLPEVHTYLLRILNAMREVSADIKIFVFDEAALRIPAYTALIGGDMDITGLKKNGRWLIDGVTFHNYPNGKQFTRDDVIFAGPQKILGEIKTLKALMAQANAKHNRKGDEALLWGLTEVNVTWQNPDREISGYGNPSFLGGQFIAEIFGFGMEHGAYMVNPWCINETDRIITDFGYIGMPSEFYPRSSYYHMQMMSTHMKGAFVLNQDNQNYVKTIATTDKNTVALMVMNQHPAQNFDFDVSLNGKNADSEKPLLIAVSADISAHFSGNIPAQTTQILVFNKKGKLQKTVTYDLAHNLKEKPPTVQ